MEDFSGAICVNISPASQLLAVIRLCWAVCWGLTFHDILNKKLSEILEQIKSQLWHPPHKESEQRTNKYKTQIYNNNILAWFRCIINIIQDVTIFAKEFQCMRTFFGEIEIICTSCHSVVPAHPVLNSPFVNVYPHYQASDLFYNLSNN